MTFAPLAKSRWARKPYQMSQVRLMMNVTVEEVRTQVRQIRLVRPRRLFQQEGLEASLWYQEAGRPQNEREERQGQRHDDTTHRLNRGSVANILNGGEHGKIVQGHPSNRGIG